MWKEATSLAAQGSAEGFWNALHIWLNKPHVVNRRLCGTQNLTEQELTTHNTSLIFPDTENYTHIKKVFLESDNLSQTVLETFANEDYNKITGGKENRKRKVDGEIIVDGEDKHDLREKKFGIRVRDLIPKQIDRCPVLRELIILDEAEFTAVFLPISTKLEKAEDSTTQDRLLSSNLAYGFKYDTEEKKVVLYIFGEDSPAEGLTAGCTEWWLKDTLLTKLLSWGQQQTLNTAITSLKLLPVDVYNAKYQYMKAKYGQDLAKNWPEKTNAEKYVFEDVAIASYLLVLWEQERKEKQLSEKQSFVDLGCGNGLLVHLLSKEGHIGEGIDVRKRTIWDMYGPETKLQEMSITPSDEHLFPDCDWLIGNHSDELTPWIPVMAARSSYKCRYFVLPCCAWDFDSKFAQKTQGISQYRSYLNYVHEVGQACGFNVSEDTLRIPSTKRVCFIGHSRTYKENEENRMDAERSAFIQEHCRHPPSQSPTAVTDNSHQHDHPGNPSSDETNDGAKVAEGSGWTATFQPRSGEEVPRNCARVDRGVKDQIMRLVFDSLLKVDDAVTKTTERGSIWNAGGSIPLPEVASMIDPSQLQQLKNECGGLQTLLKNSKHIFKIEKSRVQLRDWISSEEFTHVNKRRMKKRSQKADVDKSIYLKTQLCWFNDNHPDGCPRTSEKCSFAHGPDELREVVSSKSNKQSS